VRTAAAWWPLLAFWGGALLLTWLGVLARRRPERLVGLRAMALFAQPIAVLFLLFESLFVLIPAVRRVRYDDVFVAVDRAMLGVDATLWMEQWNTPFLDELFHVSYFLYFPMPLAALVWLFGKGRRADVERVLFVFLCCYYPAYLIYIAWPTEGPQHWLRDQHTVELQGLLLTQPIRTLIATLEPSKVDAFPSVHAAILTTTMITAWWYVRRVFWAFVPLAVCIYVSLIYTRHHYVIDVIAGVAVAVSTAWAAVKLFPRWWPNLARHLPDPGATWAAKACSAQDYSPPPSARRRWPGLPRTGRWWHGPRCSALRSRSWHWASSCRSVGRSTRWRPRCAAAARAPR
jgi:membrane-associated phospholipid phosphatase